MKQKAKYYYDKKCNPRTFERGEIYLLKEPVKEKLTDQYTGPHEILEILGNNNVKIAVGNDRTRIVHNNKFKKLRYIGERRAHVPDDSTPHPDPNRNG